MSFRKMREAVIKRIVEGWMCGHDEGFTRFLRCDGSTAIERETAEPNRPAGIDFEFRDAYRSIRIYCPYKENGEGLGRILHYATNEQLLDILDAQSCQRYR